MVLLTGYNSFIGKYLQAQLSKTQEVRELPWELLYNFDKLRNFICEIKPEMIFHLASWGNKYDQQNEKKIFEANLKGTFNLLEASKSVKYKALINFSSSSTLLPYETFYSATKGGAERLCSAFVNKYKKPVVSVRPASIYGKGDHPEHFIPSIIKAFKEKLEYSVAPGFHDWLWVEDLVAGVIKVAENAEKLKGQSINISSGISSSNYTILAILQDIFQTHGYIKRIGQIREYDTDRWEVDNTILKSLGWRPQIDLEEGLEKLVYDKE